MNDDWLTQNPMEERKLGLLDYVRAISRAFPMIVIIGTGLLLMLILRCVEAPIFRDSRPLTQWITPLVCKLSLWLLGLTIERIGAPDQSAHVSVSNHSSWLDILGLNAGRKLYFISKAEVRAWPGIGWLARATGTLFIKRDRKEARSHVSVVAERIALGHHLHFFPEGTSTDSRRVLSFKPTLFAAVEHEPIKVQPICLLYHAPKGEDERFYGWWGDMGFGPSLLQILAVPRQGKLQIHYLDAIDAEPIDRKALASKLEKAVRSVFV